MEPPVAKLYLARAAQWLKGATGAVGFKDALESRMKFVRSAAVALAFAVAAGGPSVAADGTVKEIMRDHVNPGALDFWAGGNDPPENETKAEAAERWKAAVAGAQALQRYGKALQQPGSSLPGRWAEFAKLMEEQGALGEAAARAQDMNKAFEVGGRLYDSCAGCHQTYIPRTTPRLP